MSWYSPIRNVLENGIRLDFELFEDRNLISTSSRLNLSLTLRFWSMYISIPKSLAWVTSHLASLGELAYPHFLNLQTQWCNPEVRTHFSFIYLRDTVTIYVPGTLLDVGDEMFSSIVSFLTYEVYQHL